MILIQSGQLLVGAAEMALRNCILTLLAVGCLRHPRDCGTRPYRADRHATRAEHLNNIGASTGREGTLADSQPAGFMLEGARQSCLAEVKLNTPTISSTASEQDSHADECSA